MTTNPVKIPIDNEGKIKTFSDKHRESLLSEDCHQGNLKGCTSERRKLIPDGRLEM